MVLNIFGLFKCVLDYLIENFENLAKTKFAENFGRAKQISISQPSAYGTRIC